MKKGISIILVLVTVIALLTSCALHGLVGTWTTTIDGADGQMTLRRDGTGEIYSNDTTRPCTWTATEDTLTVVQELGGIPYTFLDEVTYTVERRTLTITSEEGNTLVFEKR